MNPSYGVSGDPAELAKRRRLLRAELDRFQEEFGAFTDEELAEAKALLHGPEEALHGPEEA
nr:hypothetical protein [Micromonospora sp. DSM 115978]